MFYLSFAAIVSGTAYCSQSLRCYVNGMILDARHKNSEVTTVAWFFRFMHLPAGCIGLYWLFLHLSMLPA